MGIDANVEERIRCPGLLWFSHSFLFSMCVAMRSKSKHVRFAEDFAPSSIRLRVVCGPPDDPSMIITVRILFRMGKTPRLQFDFDRKHSDHTRRRRRQSDY
ncbi:hypothetical protein M8818_002346 [Zalaria obscura]|uniref:Uncharacterized protein n=1 Tax=Zalaria obscura TaxID=2024903 RepID=A0ACC3SHJ4_9PEZI